MLTRNLTRSIIFKYLEDFEGPYVVIRLMYNSWFTSGRSHCISEISYAFISALCVEVMAIMLNNYIIKEKLLNGSIENVIVLIGRSHSYTVKKKKTIFG